MRVIIVGDGPSAIGFVPPPDVCVIAVNGAADWLMRFDIFFTATLNPLQIERMNRDEPLTQYYAAVPWDKAHMLPSHVEPLALIESYQRHLARLFYDHDYMADVYRSGAVAGLCDNPGMIHAGDSGYGALGLAKHLGATRVLLVGIDGTQDGRISDGRPMQRARHLNHLFSTVDEPRMNIVSAGRLTAFHQVDHAEGVAWLMA